MPERKRVWRDEFGDIGLEPLYAFSRITQSLFGECKRTPGDIQYRQIAESLFAEAVHQQGCTAADIDYRLVPANPAVMDESQR